MSNLTMVEQELLAHLRNPNIHEATSDDNGNYVINLKVSRTKWAKRLFAWYDVQGLIERNILVCIPSRWNVDHNTIFINEYVYKQLFGKK